MVWDSVTLALRLFWRRIGMLLVANVLWLGLSLLIVTWPAATAGLFHLTRRVVEEELTNTEYEARLRDFWEGFRQHWLRGTLLSLLNVVFFVVLLVALWFYGRSSEQLLRFLIGPVALFALAWTGAQLYLYPLMIQRPERHAWPVAREAFLMAISYSSYTLSLLLTALAITAGAIILAGPILLVYFSMMAMLQTVALRAILVRRGELAPSPPRNWQHEPRRKGR